MTREPTIKLRNCNADGTRVQKPREPSAEMMERARELLPCDSFCLTEHDETCPSVHQPIVALALDEAREEGRLENWIGRAEYLAEAERAGMEAAAVIAEDAREPSPSGVIRRTSWNEACADIAAAIREAAIREAANKGQGSNDNAPSIQGEGAGGGDPTHVGGG